MTVPSATLVVFFWVSLVSGLNMDGILLLSFKYSVVSDPLSVLSGWNYNDATPCSWNGVACTSVTTGDSSGPSRVISLILPNAGLVGPISPDLGLLDHLRHLDLSDNAFNGSIPTSLFDARELQVLSLSGNRFSGEIPKLIGGLRELQLLNLSDNTIVGKVPENISSLPNLTVVGLSNNLLFGDVPGRFRKAEWVDFSSNVFNGSLPENGVGGDGLRFLNLSNNRISGQIPASFGSNLPNNATVDLSYNNLTGAIPVSAAFAVQTPAALSGNPGLCGKPLRTLCSIPSTLSDPPATGDSPPAFAAMPKSVAGEHRQQQGTAGRMEKDSGLRPAAIAGIVVGDLAGIGILFFLFMYIYHAKKKKREAKDNVGLILKPSRSFAGGVVQKQPPSTEKKKRHAISVPCIGKERGEKSESDYTSESTGSDSDRQAPNPPEQKTGVLVAVDGETELELETLLKASAYILGATGSSIVYKAVLADGTAFAVRRIGEGGAAEKMKDFEAQVRSIAKLRHPNLLRLRGFYWGIDEKLLIHDFAANGSLANITYKKVGSSPYYLPWDARIRIAKGVATGLAYLHDKKALHGHLKPSNVLLAADMEPLIGDFGLDRLTSSGDMSARPGGSFRHFGSKRSTFSQGSLQEAYPTSTSPYGGTSSTTFFAPESFKNLKPNTKWDVYSFGVLLLELLTGRIFEEAELGEWTAFAFAPEERNRLLRLADGAMRGETVGREEAVITCMRLGFSCASVAPQKRPTMREVVQVIDKIPSSSSAPSSSILPY